MEYITRIKLYIFFFIRDSDRLSPGRGVLAEGGYCRGNIKKTFGNISLQNKIQNNLLPRQDTDFVIGGISLKAEMFALMHICSSAEHEKLLNK